MEMNLKILKFYLILDQSQMFISNGFGACQSYLLICNNTHFSMGLQTNNGKLTMATLSYAISKE